MQLIVTGIHQRTASVALREQLAFNPATIEAALGSLQQYVDEGLIISTCNRVEVYGILLGTPDATAVQRFIADWHQVDAAEIAPHLYTYTGADAVQHLFRLASGLDSMVLGEEQIMGQLKVAMNVAAVARTLGPLMRRLLDSALATGKLTRTKTGIARLNLSVVSVALDLARQVIGGLSDHRVLVIGAGRMAELALKHLHGGATHSVTVINRTDERAVELAARYGVDAAPYATLEALLAEHDVVLSATASPEPIIDAAMVQRARANNDRQMILLDLAVPRDVSPDVALLPNVKLFDVDSMQAISAANRAARTAEVGVAEQLIQYEADKFMAWWSSQQVVPTIRALRERAEAIRTSELQRTLSRLSHLSPHEQEAIGALSAAIINKLLHQPIATLKDPRKGNELSAVVQQLFQL